MAPEEMDDEQVQALKEKIKNMPPEELKEFHKKQCIFCQIISGKIQSKRVYEDDEALVILDINPANPGHMLIMPKEHYAIMPQIPEETIAHLFTVVKTLSNTALRSLGVQGSNVIVANGVAAGQKAQHFMIHLIPRKEEDGLEFTMPQKDHSENELEKTQQLLSLEGARKKQRSPEQQAPPSLPVPSSIKAPLPKTVPLKPQKKETQKEEKPSSKKDSGLDLDDIARVLGAK